MTSTERTKILKKINLPSFFTKRGPLAFYVIENDGFKILVGLYIDSTLDKDNFFVQYFIQPLFIPFPTYVFTIGKRIGGHWSLQDIKKIENAISNIGELKSFEDIKETLRTAYGNLESSYKHQLLGYIHLIFNEFELANFELQKIVKSKSQDSPKWKTDEIERVNNILTCINNSEYEKAKYILIKWQETTISSLKFK